MHEPYFELGEADRHIVQATENFLRQQQIVAELRTLGQPTNLALQGVETMRRILDAMYWHRQQIAANGGAPTPLTAHAVGH